MTYWPLIALLSGFVTCKEHGTLNKRGIGFNYLILTRRCCVLVCAAQKMDFPHRLACNMKSNRLEILHKFAIYVSSYLIVDSLRKVTVMVNKKTFRLKYTRNTDIHHMHHYWLFYFYFYLRSSISYVECEYLSQISEHKDS